MSCPAEPPVAATEALWHARSLQDDGATAMPGDAIGNSPSVHWADEEEVQEPKNTPWKPEQEAQLQQQVAQLRKDLENVTAKHVELKSQLQKAKHMQDGASHASSDVQATRTETGGKLDEEGGVQVSFPDEIDLGIGTNSLSVPLGSLSRTRTRSRDVEGDETLPTGSRRPRLLTHQSTTQLVKEVEQLDEVLRDLDSDFEPDRPSLGGAEPTPTMKNFHLVSALGSYRIVQAMIYLIALGGLIFVLVAKSTDLGADDHHDEDHGDSHADSHTDTHTDTDHGHGHGMDVHSNVSTTLMMDHHGSDHHGSDHHLRLLGAGPSLLATNMAYVVGCAGLVAFFFNLKRQPLVVGYLTAGILMGTRWGLGVVENVEEIQDLRALGVIFLCFMTGLEMDLRQITTMARPVAVAGLVQLPITAGFLALVFLALEDWGMNFGKGKFALLYCSLTCAYSSTMLVVKLLTEQAEMDSSSGKLTAGILFFQDLWGIVLLAVQPELSNNNDNEVVRTTGMIAAVSIVALLYAKFVMPAVYRVSSKSDELMLVMSLSWCFFICCLATLPGVELSMELASLVSGVALATFPYSMEFNSKIKYIRDFFITFYFAGLGMQIPAPSLSDIGIGILLSVIILIARWVGVFLVALAVGSTGRVAAMSTINLSNLGEFALVICSLGLQYDHINNDTIKLILWAFIILLLISNLVIPRNYRVLGLLSWIVRRAKITGSNAKEEEEADAQADKHSLQEDRTIILLGFHKIAAMLIAHWEHNNRALLSKVHVIDFHEDIATQLTRGVTCSFGDISSPEEVHRLHPYEANLVICSIPDAMLRGITNQQLLMVANKVWPKADVIVTADNQSQVHILYEAGADYVLRMAKLCAERLHELIVSHSTHARHHHHKDPGVASLNVFEVFKRGDQDERLERRSSRLFGATSSS